MGSVLAAGMTVVMRGPVSTMSRVTQNTIAENNMLASGKLAIMMASNQPGGGDCDGDSTAEPVAWSLSGTGTPPGGGGFLPANIGASLTDPWGTTYGYCAWDHGTDIQTTCATPLLRLKGAAAANGPAIAVLSAGPDKVFQTSCADAPDYVVKVGGSDDIVLPYGYAEASISSGSGATSDTLWNLKGGAPTIAEIDKDLEVNNQGGDVVFGVDSTTDAGKPSIKVDYIRALTNAKIEAVTRLLGSAGVEGTTTNAGNYGVFGSNTGAGGVAVMGLANSGSATGVFGQTSGATPGAVGTKGEALATTGNTYGVTGLSKSSTGVGINALADNAAGTTYGLYGQSQSTSGTGVYGYGSAATGANYGVLGRSNSAAGFAGYFENGAHGWGVFSANDGGLGAGKYWNWSTTRGTTGYGIRDSGGTIEAKNSGGTWAPVGGSALPDCMENELVYKTASGWGCVCLDEGPSGVDWTPRDSDRPWRDVASSDDGTKLVALTDGGRIYTSADSGVTWTARASNRNWWGVASSADGTKLVAVVNGGQIWTSTDSGANWTARNSVRDWRHVASSADGTKLVATVYGEYIYTSTNSGSTWTARDPYHATSHSWGGIASSADGTKLVAMAYGSIYTSTDSGINWTARSSTGEAWSDVASSADGTKLVATEESGYIYTSANSGASWTIRTGGGALSGAWEGVASSADGTKLIAVGRNGKLVTSADSGVTWTDRSTSGGDNWYGVASSADATKLIASTANGGGGQLFTSGPSCLPPPI
ncbi:MAG: hypothetical protein B7Y08_06450 [Rhodospirillales bacterium 24-66-33]|nr:MAG: hypothetical protein B7Y08_06450 [Rhodospirillales bacterium 24-66-33]